jgi:hypothetical protein
MHELGFVLVPKHLLYTVALETVGERNDVPVIDGLVPLVMKTGELIDVSAMENSV